MLVIGAGMAGVTAARTLHDNGYGVTVLEGRPDRVGGRIWSSRAWPDAEVDLGASWMTHETINPLAQLAKRHGVKTVRSELFNLSLREANGQVLSPVEVADLLGFYFENYAAVKEIAADRESRGLPDWPASAAFAQVVGGQKLDPVTLRRLGFFINFAVEEPNASPLTDLSLYNWDDDLVLIQLYTSVFPQGYKQLIDILAGPLDIRLGHAVEGIEYGRAGVAVHTNHGTFRAPQAIVTLPHGVLRSDTVAFEPLLPASKRAAIKRVHTGVSNKFYFRFPSVFWDPAYDTLGRIPPTRDAGWSTWINIYKYTGKPILLVFNRNDVAAQLETKTDKQVIEIAMDVLRKAYGPGIPTATAVQRSHWGGDRFSEGTIPHLPPGASSADYAEIGQPVGPLGFAGDSTDPDFPGLVFGAYRSGLREANRIMGVW